MTIHVAKGEISVVRGDIADQDTEAIVNAANNQLWMGAGVAGAIKRKGGAAIEQEAMKKGPIEIGSAVSTSAGALKATCVIHAAVMGPDLRTEAGFIASATKNSLALAQKDGIRSIAFPALGTGVGGFSLYHCASIMIGVAIEFMIMTKVVREIRFVLFDEEAKEIFEKELKHRFTAHSHP
jgi:O-acetyl-ADP-ribose deacetylase